MRSRITLLFFILMGLNSLIAQQFTKVTTGAIVNSPSDSRSCNFIDLNGDFLDDIFISNGPSAGQNNMLYLSNGNGFTTVTGDPIVQDGGKSDGASFADVDNDGDLDAMVVTWYGQQNFFYRNNGDNSFSLEPNTANGGPGTFSETTSFGDYDQDGWVDLYVTNSTNFTTNPASIRRNLLFKNDGAGDFEKVNEGEPVNDANISRSVQWVDYDLDGDPDLWVSNEENQANYLYENEGGVFTKQTNLGLNDVERSSTGSSWADIDNDGDFDLFIANFGGQNNQLFRNNGVAGFTSINNAVSQEGGCSFGSGFADFDNDGDLDLFVANGFCNGSLVNYLYKNDGQGNFSKDASSITDLSTSCSFGMAWGDYDNDGYLDLVVANCKNNAPLQPANSLYHNNGGTNHYVKFRLEGVVSNRSGIGAIVRLKANIGGQDIWQTRQVNAQTGYCGQNSLTVHFGLGDAAQVDSVMVHWPSGDLDVLANLTIDSSYSVIEMATTDVRDNLALLPFQLQLFPNPSTGPFDIIIDGEVDFSEPIFLQITNLLGKELERFPISSKNESIALKEMPAGIYMVRLLQGKQFSLAHKLVIN